MFVFLGAKTDSRGIYAIRNNGFARCFRVFFRRLYIEYSVDFRDKLELTSIGKA